MIEEFKLAAKEMYEKAKKEGRLIDNPSDAELKKLALKEPEVKESNYGSIVAVSEPMSRAAMFTKNNIDDKFGNDELKLLENAKKHLAKEELVVIDCQVGDGSEGITARLIIPKNFAHVAYAGKKLFVPAKTENPTYQVIMFADEHFEKNKKKILPQKDVTIRLAFSKEGEMVKFVRNSNYFGEWKKGVFAGEDWRVKQKKDAIFLHAGCRQDYLEGTHGDYITQNSLFIALSANGKTSTTCKILARKGKEKSWLIQDDGGTLRMDGSFHGFEAGGLFVKTDGLNPKEQIEAYYGCLKQSTFLENIWLEKDGDIDFYNIEFTSNGRAVIERSHFTHASKDINADKIHNIFLITRGNIIPAISKLTPEQTTAFMVLGQSMESSAGDPTQAGKIKNEFFYDPFIAGDRSEHANLFYKILKNNPHINCFLLNTGGIGEGDKHHDISLQDTMNILDSVLRGGLEDWVYSPDTGLMVPKAIRLVDSIYMHPERLFLKEYFEALQNNLCKQRNEELKKYPNLNKKVLNAFK
ncbi:MAG: phosphoenolpyruvate carboxykinase [Candidatus Woesearchaeota archaeon]